MSWCMNCENTPKSICVNSPHNKIKECDINKKLIILRISPPTRKPFVTGVWGQLCEGVDY